jgi:hypothetical protein
MNGKEFHFNHVPSKSEFFIDFMTVPFHRRMACTRTNGEWRDARLWCRRRSGRFTREKKTCSKIPWVQEVGNRKEFHLNHVPSKSEFFTDFMTVPFDRKLHQTTFETMIDVLVSRGEQSSSQQIHLDQRDSLDVWKHALDLAKWILSLNDTSRVIKKKNSIPWVKFPIFFWNPFAESLSLAKHIFRGTGQANWNTDKLPGDRCLVTPQMIDLACITESPWP